MAKKSKDDEMSIMDAVDNLTGMAELDIDTEKEGLTGGSKG